MALPGNLPSGSSSSRAKLADWMVVPNTPFKGRSPRLAKDLHPSVYVWWAAVSKMPHCVLWGPSDWVYAADTALVKHHFYVSGDTKFAAESRIREDNLGTTVEARRKLRIRYEEPEKAPVVAPPERTADRRARLSVVNAS